MAKKKLTPLQQQYNKELKRIKRSMKNIEKRGYFFNDLSILETPKRVTKQSLKKIQDTKAKDLYEKAVYLNEDTGEFISGKEARKQDYKQRAEKAKETINRKSLPQYTSLKGYDKEHLDYIQKVAKFEDVVISNFKAEIANFDSRVTEAFNTWLDTTGDKIGKQRLAQLLDEAKSRGMIDYKYFASDLEKAMATIAGLTDFLPNISDKMKEEIFQAMEDMEGLD